MRSLEQRAHAICDKYPICDPVDARYAKRDADLQMLHSKAIAIEFAKGIFVLVFGTALIVAILAMFGMNGSM